MSDCRKPKSISRITSWLVISLAGGGLHVVAAGAKAPEFHQRIWTMENGLPDNRVRAILQTRDGYIWAATPAGLIRFDGQRFIVLNRASRPGMPNDNCVSLAEDSAGTLCVGFRGAVAFKTRTGFVTEPGLDGSLDPIHLSSSRDGGVWGCCASCVYRFRRGETKSFPFPRKRQPIMAIQEDDEGGLWVGCYGGCLRLDPHTGSYGPPLVAAELPPLPVIAFERDAAGARWMLFGSAVPAKYAETYQAWLGCIAQGQWLRKPDFSTPGLRIDQRCHFLTRIFHRPVDF